MKDVVIGTLFLTIVELNVIQKGKNLYVIIMNVQIIVRGQSCSAPTILESIKSGRNQGENRSGGMMDGVVRTVLYLTAHLPNVILMALTLAAVDMDTVLEIIKVHVCATVV